MKKIEPLEALAKIKVLTKRFYENIGREEIYDIDDERRELIERIEDITNKVNIPAKNLVVEELNEEFKPKQEEEDDIN